MSARVLAPSRKSPGVAFSASLWLIAFSQGTKIIAVGQIPLDSPDLGLNLGLGSLEAGSGKTAKNFVCEAAAPATAQDIPAYGGRPGYKLSIQAVY
jgi:hypothetical protein